MRSRVIQKILAEQTGSPIGEIDQRIRGARKAGVIRSGPRGNAAPIMTKEEVAQHVLCMASRSVVDAEAIRKRLAEECVYVPAPQNPADVLPEGTTFAAAVAMIVDGSLRTRDWDDRIEVGKDGTIAFIIISPNKGRPAVRLLFSGSEQDRKSYYPYTSQYSPNAFDTAYATRVGHWFTYPCKWLAMNGDMIDRAEAAAADEKAKDVDTRAA